MIFALMLIAAVVLSPAGWLLAVILEAQSARRREAQR